MPSADYIDRFSDTAGGQRLYDLVLFVQTSDDPSNNRSTVQWGLFVFQMGVFNSYSGFSNPWSVTIDGQNFSGNWTYDFRNTNSKLIETGSKLVNHNSDGSKTITVRASATGSSIGSADTGNRSFGLTTYPRAPNPPATVSASVPVARTIAVSWDAASGGAGVSNYTVQRSENSGSYGNTFTTTSRNFTDTNLNPRSTYRYQVRANGPGGSSGFRQSETRTIAPAASPPVTTAERSLRTVTVTMTEPSVIDNTTNIVSYTTERRQDGGSWGDAKTTTDLNNRSITYTNLPSETNQQFRGRANTNRTSSDFSESQTIFIPGVPDPPEEVLALRFGTAVLVVISPPLSDNGAPVLSYTMERREAPGRTTNWSAWGQTETLSSSTTSIVKDITELKKTYQYRVLATNEEGNSEVFTESDPVYIPKVVNIYERDPRTFRDPIDYKRYDATIGSWVGLNIAQKFTNGEWVDLD
jgi:hypothetical protein